ncbi:hypothetical protein GQ53DRAFT_745956 [Thozetella sp. PMI_491]|nr:hypothetical protein GQ53DRAFT_745956 [Thozetella sp. PMI_491]
MRRQLCHLPGDSIKADCNDRSLGRLMYLLSQNALYPPAPHKWRGSILDLRDPLTRIAQGLKSPSQRSAAAHHFCNTELSLLSSIEETIHNIPIIVTETHRAHLAAQARKTGLREDATEEPPRTTANESQ